MIRRALLGFAALWGLSAMATTVQAQIASPGFNDPFFLYYGFYLPRQAALAAQPTTPRILNDVASARQNVINSERSGLYDPISSPLIPGPYDPANPFNAGRVPERLPRLPMSHLGGRSSSATFPAPFNRAARYYPTLRAGNGVNSNSTAGSSRYARQSPGAPSLPANYGLNF